MTTKGARKARMPIATPVERPFAFGGSSPNEPAATMATKNPMMDVQPTAKTPLKKWLPQFARQSGGPAHTTVSPGCSSCCNLVRNGFESLK